MPCLFPDCLDKGPRNRRLQEFDQVGVFLQYLVGNEPAPKLGGVYCRLNKLISLDHFDGTIHGNQLRSLAEVP